MNQQDLPIGHPTLPDAMGPNHAHRCPARTRRVLVADDMPEIRGLVARFLKGYGYDVSTAENGRDAWRMFRQAPHDLVVTDMKMPVMDGAALMARIKTMAPETPVVVVTGDAAEAARVISDIHGTVGAVLMKPFDFDTLLKTVAALIESEASDAAITITV